MSLLNKSLPNLIPGNSYFFVNNDDLVKQLPVSIIYALQYFFDYQLEINNFAEKI